MANKNESFQYGIDNLYTVPDNNPLKKYNYVNGIIDKYQTLRNEEINKKQDWEEMQAAKERYSKKPSFTSQHAPFKDPTSMLVAVRENGYLAYIDKVPSYNPFYEIATIDVESVSEYMNEYYGNHDLGFFKFRGVLSCIVDKTKLLTIKFTDLVNPLAFCESYVYDDVKKEIVFQSPYYGEVTVKAYTKDEFINIDGGSDSHYFYVTNSQYDLIPKGKYPGYPLYKRIVVDGVTNDFDTIEVAGLTIDVNKSKGKILSGELEYAEDGKCIVYIEPNSSQAYLHVAFSPKYMKGIEAHYELPVSFKKGDKVYKDTVKLSTAINDFYPLTALVKITSPDIYLEVPMEYEICFPLTDYVDKTKVKEINSVTIFYLDKSQKATVKFDSFTSDGMVKFVTDPVTIPNQSELPTELRFNVAFPVTDKVGMYPTIYLDGYSTSAIYRVPDNYLRVEQSFAEPLTYTEFSDKKFRITFKGNGTLAIQSVSLKRLSSALGYFHPDDFTMEKVSEAKGVFTYDLVLSKKIFDEPVNKTTDTLKFIFEFDTVKKDGTKVLWPGEVLSSDMEITYFADRWLLSDVTYDNFLIGEGTFTFRLFDKLLNAYTDKYSSDPRLTLSDGTMGIFGNMTAITGDMDWDFRTATWSYRVITHDYKDIAIAYQGVASGSNLVTIKRGTPIHPFKATRRDTTLFENITGRVYYDVSFNDDIRSIYIDGGLVTTDRIFSCFYSRNGVGVMSAVLSPDRKRIIGLGFDFTPTKGVTSIPYSFNVTGVNDFDYSKWPVPLEWKVPVKPQKDGINFEFRLINFGYGKDVEGILSLKLPALEDAQVVATIVNPATGITVCHPNFDPIGNSDFRSMNVFIGNELSAQKKFVLVMDIYEYDNAGKDNTLPNRLYYSVELPFEVS